MTPTDLLDKAIKLALNHFKLEDSIHGPAHWGRVYQNGMRLAEHTGADLTVVTLFAFYHDCKRDNDGKDLYHGPRAAKFVYETASFHFHLDSVQVTTLAQAVGGHTNRIHSTNPTVGTCWDADRLDISRIGTEDDPYHVDPYYLSTKAAKDPEIIRWAEEKAQAQIVPDFIIPYL